MERIRAGRLGLVVVLMWNLAAQAGPIKVRGRVVGPDGAPVIGAEVGTSWIFEDGKNSPDGGTKTDADGSFEFETAFYDRPIALVAMSADRKIGGLVTVAPIKASGEPIKSKLPPTLAPVEIKLGPLIRVHGNLDFPELNKDTDWILVTMSVGSEEILVAEYIASHAAFDLRLPANEYLFEVSGSYELQQVERKLTLKTDQPDLDLATIHLEATPLAKMYGKEPPPLHITDARGISKGIKLSDFPGKWVILDFWGYWCGPCVGRSLPNLMEIYDEHPEDRDKFVVLAFHSKDIASFEELDPKLKPIIESTWGGRELPFPILLDSTGQTVETYGISIWPTTIAINPEGKVVRGGEYTFEKTLPKIPAARRIPRLLDKQFNFGMIGNTKLNEFTKYLDESYDLPIKLDEPALDKAGIVPDTLIPLAMSGQVSLRSWLELGLEPLGLVAVPGPDGLIVTTPQPDAKSEPSAVQPEMNVKINRKLDGPTSFDFTDRSLTEVAGYFEEQTGESFVLDPADQIADRLDPKTTVTGKASGVPLRNGLKDLLGPLGIEAVVRDEVVILTKPARP